MAINPEIVSYKSDAGFDIPAICLAAYDSGGSVTTVEGDTVTADLLVLGNEETRLDGVTKGASAGEFAFLSDYT